MTARRSAPARHRWTKFSSAASRASRTRFAFADPADKARVTGQSPRRLTYAEADSAVTTLATHFVESGLPVSSIVAVQLPNTVELMITALAAWRAGLVVALLPLLWRQAELTDALNRIGARALVTSGKIDGINHAEIGMQAAAEVFSIRHVAAFGDQLPEGPTPLDDVLAEFREPPLFPGARSAPRRAHYLRCHERRHARRSAQRRAGHCRRPGHRARSRHQARRANRLHRFAGQLRRALQFADRGAGQQRHIAPAPSVRPRRAALANQRTTIATR